MDRQISKGVENKNSTNIAIERCPQQKSLDGWRSYRAFIKHTKSSSMDQEAIETKSQKPWWIEIAIIATKKRSLRGSIDSLAVERYQEAIEITKKQFFKEEKYECNQICYSTKDPNNILSSQNHLSIRKMSSI